MSADPRLEEWWDEECGRLLLLAELEESKLNATPRWRWFRRYRIRNRWIYLVGVLQNHEQLRARIRAAGIPPEQVWREIKDAGL